MNKTTFMSLFCFLTFAYGWLVAEEGRDNSIQQQMWTDDYAETNHSAITIFEEDHANCFEDPCCSSNCFSSFFSGMKSSFKVRIAAFWPLMSGRFREIYGDVTPNYQIEAGFTFRDCYQVWVNFDWIYKRGHSHSLHDSTTLNIGNLSIGLSLLHHFSKSFTAYAGLGPSFGRINVHNTFTHIHRNETKYPVGLAVKSGLLYHFNCRYFVDIFVDYLYQPTSFKTKVDIGGLKTGIGIGIDF